MKSTAWHPPEVGIIRRRRRKKQWLWPARLRRDNSARSDRCLENHLMKIEIYADADVSHAKPRRSSLRLDGRSKIAAVVLARPRCHRSRSVKIQSPKWLES